ncbi:dicarboxylic amino acid permease [Phlyctema vagabunda]|uniref:Dicarboxylic amino acid permease n=1 Tax=Phlyctema vagabunda TaxID=108571 RepID=A0ABR4PBP3_9HELO
MDAEKTVNIQDDIANSRTEKVGEVIPTSEAHLKRELKPRHVSMFAIAGSIGTGLVIGSDTALASGGPGSLLILYLILRSCIYFVMTALAEMECFAPMEKRFSGYATRYCDPALGFVTGWNYLIKYRVLLANNLAATSLVINYWNDKINAGVWITVFGVAIVLLNVGSMSSFFGSDQKLT